MTPALRAVGRSQAEVPADLHANPGGVHFMTRVPTNVADHNNLLQWEGDRKEHR